VKITLPHLEPILFAKELLEKDKDTCLVQVEFPHPASLAMIIEAAAQSSAGFASANDDAKQVAFLVLLKDVVLLQETKYTQLTIGLKVEQNLATINYFSFIAKHKDEEVARGTFAISL